MTYLDLWFLSSNNSHNYFTSFDFNMDYLYSVMFGKGEFRNGCNSSSTSFLSGTPLAPRASIANIIDVEIFEKTETLQCYVKDMVFPQNIALW